MSLQEMMPIPGLEGLYSATVNGEIFSHRTLKTLKPKVHGNGYSVVCVVDDAGDLHDILIHRLVCLAFHGYPKIWQTDVNHIDCDKSNNRPDNLEWCTRKQNMRAAIGMGRPVGRGKRHDGSKNVKVPVVGYDQNGSVVELFDSVSAAVRAGYANVSTAYRSDGKRTCGGLYWRAATQAEINSIISGRIGDGAPDS